MKNAHRFWLLAIFALAALFELTLLLSGRRILISERLVRPGEHFVTAEWGDLGKSAQASLACRYFTGRALKVQVFWYSGANIFGRDSCPFLAGDG